MDNQINLQYLGFLKTPALWDNSDVYSLNQLDYNSTPIRINDYSKFNEKRLGKRVEQFLCFQLEQSRSFEIIANNLQVKDGKQTIGELDLLLKDSHSFIHLEIVYKFYLYNESVDNSDYLSNWVGPNKKDSLVFKLKKLLTKQLPLLSHFSSKQLLEKYFISDKEVEQRVCFKAQLFMPFNSSKIDISPINASCIIGFYIPFTQFELLKDYEFFIPNKLDWLIEPHYQVDWLDFNTSKIEINKQVVQLRSPLCWLKSKNNTLQKCFVTFWENGH